MFRDAHTSHGDRITEEWREVELPDGYGAVGALALNYSVNQGRVGWWLRLAAGTSTTDFSRFEDGNLILRVLQTPPEWRVELKSGSRTHDCLVRIRPEEVCALRSRGFTDVVIPLDAFGGVELTELRELTIGFDGDHLDVEHRRGELRIAQIGLSKTDRFADDPDAILEDLGQRAFRWFETHRHPDSGLILDRAPNREGGRPSADTASPSSVASVGYYLTLLPEWVRLGYLTHEEAARRAERTLRFIVDEVPCHKGVLYHFVDWRNGERWTASEVSTLDHAICANGAMTAGMAFGGGARELAERLLDRVDWQEFLITDPQSGKRVLSLGWTPEEGFLAPAGTTSSEMAMLYFLAIGSQRGIEPEIWFNTAVDWQESAVGRVLNAQHPLFTSQYGMNWHDLEGFVFRDGVDLSLNARRAALLNRGFCRRAAGAELTYHHSEGGWWGISSGDSPNGYSAFGPVGLADGIVWPSVALASLPWAPSELKKDLVRWRNSRAWHVACGPYGLSPFRIGREPWVGDDLIGIDLGSFAVSLANHRARTVWNLWMSHPVAQVSYSRLGLVTAERQ
ncbi:MAG: hypothetical protein H0W30_09815 [Gemmatimonadaceae bacterium]|nr:hypothetical protein [Planctomycetaceae bacterium]MBA3558883.1 hypothetical protein [Gemmatimonadaceae bacterium]